MIFLGLMVLVLTVSVVFSSLAEGRRRVARGSYGFTAPARGLPTDVPLSSTSRAAIDSDLSVFSTELRELDFDADGRDLTAAARQLHTTALSTYEKARSALRDARTDSQATYITHLMEEGRHALACARAVTRGQGLPRRTPPCFFDPAHGPSTATATWAAGDGSSRRIPACAVDAARIGLGAPPRIRMAGVPPSALPYWEDRGHAAWAQGYFGIWMNDPQLRALTQGATMIRGFSRLMGMLDS